MPENLALILEPCTELSQYGLQGRASTSQGQCAQLKEWGTRLFCVFDGRLFQSSGCRGSLGVTYPKSLRTHPVWAAPTFSHCCLQDPVEQQQTGQGQLLRWGSVYTSQGSSAPAPCISVQWS